ncbi:5963_t:CDS:1, partial [Scutellospora calospora]
ENIHVVFIYSIYSIKFDSYFGSNPITRRVRLPSCSPYESAFCNVSRDICKSWRFRNMLKNILHYPSARANILIDIPGTAIYIPVTMCMA